MTRALYLLAAAAASLCIGSTAMAEGSPDDVLVENSRAKLTRGDYEADLLRVPPDMRVAFASDPKRLTVLLNGMLVAKTLAAEARAAGVDREPEVARMLALESDRALAQVQLRRIEETAGAEFDAKTETMLVKAREDYAVQKDRYRGSEEVQASHILFSTEALAPEAALARANETRAKLLAGADFATLAKEISDDPSAKANLGELGWFGPGKMDPAFTKAAFELKKVGDISEPVQSRFGYHLIRLEGRRPPRQLSFDEVKEGIMADLRKRYIDNQRDTKIALIKTDPNMKVDQKAVDGLVNHIDPREVRGSLQQAK
jgi:peptidyl-prolyl cis-trans isomerase C